MKRLCMTLSILPICMSGIFAADLVDRVKTSNYGTGIELCILEGMGKSPLEAVSAFGKPYQGALQAVVAFIKKRQKSSKNPLVRLQTREMLLELDTLQ